ncbi:hypothetical protein [Microcoleus vaginatus]|uniref:hypothetical protein n=1 Tax=Microcoleus vaginatus TaxID=119532 RepID=UPI004040A6A4
MKGTVFKIGYTDCGFTMAALVKHHPSSVIGTFWLPETVEDYNNVGSKWIDYVLENNQAQAMFDDIDILKAEPHLYRHMVIVLTGNSNNPCDYSFVAGITRFLESRSLLQVLAEHNIPAHTEVSYPRFFYDESGTGKGYELWSELSLNDWNEYIRLQLVAEHGKSMLKQWWERTGKSA